MGVLELAALALQAYIRTLDYLILIEERTPKDISADKIREQFESLKPIRDMNKQIADALGAFVAQMKGTP